MKIGELAERTGVSVRMLRYYEAEGLLRPARARTGYRDFSDSDVETVQRIRLLGSAGLTLGTIQQLLPCVQSGHPSFTPCVDLRRILTEQIELFDRRIETLKKSRSVLAHFLYNAS